MFYSGAAFRSEEGWPLFGGPNGYNIFHPDRITERSSVPNVVLTAASVRKRASRVRRAHLDVERIAIDWNDDFFGVEFAALDFLAPQENRCRYKLEGFNHDWVDIGARRQIGFDNLDPRTERIDAPAVAFFLRFAVTPPEKRRPS